MPIYAAKTHWYATDRLKPAYTTYNIYYPGNWMPNCVAWTYARWNELANVSAPGGWPWGGGADWYTQGVNLGLAHDTQFIPQVGACICYQSTEPDPDHEHGHVAIIEQIHRSSPGGSPDFVIVSNSFWDDDRTIQPQDAFPFFYTSKIYVNNPGTLYNNNGTFSVYNFEGILYHPNYPPDVQPTPIIDQITTVLLAFTALVAGKKRTKKLHIRR